VITQIGLVAGEIWEYLEYNSLQGTLENVVNAIEKDRNLILMSVGWLAREGHITLEGDSSNYRIKLIEEKK